MNTALGQNQVQERVSLDTLNSYPTGLLAALGPYYSDSQELTITQLRLTANQANLSAQQDAAYASQNLALERSGTISANSDSAASAATVYVNGAIAVNSANQIKSDSANIAYANANAIERACRDAAYSAFLITEAANILQDRISTNTMVFQLGNSPPYTNPGNLQIPSTISTLVSQFKNGSQQNVSDASGNVLAYINNTQTLLNNAIVKSRSVSTNLILVSALNTFVKTVAQVLLFPLSEIYGKHDLVIQNVPSIVLASGINMANAALVFISAVRSKLTDNTVNLSTYITAADVYANSLSTIARSKDLNMYLQYAIQNNLINSAKTMMKYGTQIAIPNNNPYTPYGIASANIEASAAAASAKVLAVAAVNAAASSSYPGVVVSAESAVISTINAGGTTAQVSSAVSNYSSVVATAESAIVAAATAAAAISPIHAADIAINADKSACNARDIYNVMTKLSVAFTNTTTREAVIVPTINTSIASIVSMLETVGTITNNYSPQSAKSFTRRAYNTISAVLQKYTELEASTLDTAADASSVLTLLNKAYSIVPAVSDTVTIQNKLWAANAASAKAREISDKLKDAAFLFSRNAHNPVTSQRLAIQTASANRAGAEYIYNTARIARLSNPVIQTPLLTNPGYKASIRAKILPPINIRPSLEILIRASTVESLRPDSIRSINATTAKIGEEIQQLKENSIFLLRQ